MLKHHPEQWSLAWRPSHFNIGDVGAKRTTIFYSGVQAVKNASTGHRTALGDMFHLHHEHTLSFLLTQSHIQRPTAPNAHYIPKFVGENSFVSSV